MSDELGRDYSDGEVVFWEGEEGNTMYVIQRGQVRVTKITGEGDATIAILGPGEVFGEMALFAKQSRSTTVTAMEDARILSIDKAKFFQTVARDPSLAFNLLEVMSDRLRQKDQEFASFRKRRLEILRSGMDLEETCRIILEEASDSVEADNGSVMILSDDKKTLRIVAAYGTEIPDKVKLDIGEGIAGDVLVSGQAELVNNVTDDPRFKPGELSLCSVICVPLTSDNEKLGIINLSRVDRDKLFNPLDLRFIKTLSIYAGLAVQNAIKLARMEGLDE